MAENFARGQLLGTERHWLVSIRWAGMDILLSHEDLVVPSDDGDRVYAGVLATGIELEEGVDFFAQSVSQMSQPVAAVWPVNVPELVSRGHDLASATGEIAEWIEGTTWEERRVVLVGRIVEPEYGAPDEEVNASIEENFYDDRALVPAASLMISTDTWGSHAENAAGRTYPIILGAPGRLGSSATTGSPAYMVDTTAHTLLLAGHRVDAGTVWIYDGLTAGEAFTVTHTTDALGQICAVVDISAAAVITIDDAIEYYAAWDTTLSAGGGGWPHPRQPGTYLSGAGDVLEWMLQRSSIRYDQGRTAAARAYLNRFRIDTVIEERVSPFDWVASNLLPLLPLSIATGPSGLRPVVWKYDATRSDAVAHLDMPAIGGERIGPISYEGEIANSLTLDYGLYTRIGETTRTRTLAATVTDGDSGSSASHICDVSRRRYGEASWSKSTHIVYDPATAGLILAVQALARALPHRLVAYRVPAEEVGWLEYGAVVLLSDSEVYLDEVVAMVSTSQRAEDGSVIVSFRLVENPARDRR